MRFRRSIAAAGAVVALAAGVAGCKSTTALEHEYPSTGIVVGSGTSAGSRIVAEIYAGALRGTGVDVMTDLGVGDRLDYIRALDEGRISVVPDDTAALLAYFRRTADTQTASAPASPAPGTETAASGAGDQGGGPEAAQGGADPLVGPLSRALPGYLRISDPALAARTETLVVSDRTAQREGLRTLSDLAGHCPEMRAAFVAGLVSDARTRSALADGYGCTFADVTLTDTPEEAADAVSGGDAAVAAVTNLSPATSEDGYTVLDDDRGAMPTGHLVPLFRAGALRGPQIDALDNVAGELTSEDLAAMIRRVRVDGDAIADVVGGWRAQHGV